MYLLPFFRFFLFSVFFIHCQTRTLSNENTNTNKNGTLKEPQVKVRNVSTGSTVGEEELKAESSERTYMRDYGTKYDPKRLIFSPSEMSVSSSENNVQIIVNLSRHRFHNDDGIDIHFAHSSSDGESEGNNSNGYYAQNKHPPSGKYVFTDYK